VGRRVSDGQSVRVAVPVSTTIIQGQFALLDGVLGMAVQGIVTNSDGLVTSVNGNTVPAGLVAAEVVLAIDDAEIETSQIDTDDNFAVGDKVYWDAVNVRFTTVAGAGPYCGVVTVAKDANDVIWFRFVALMRSVETDVVGELDSLTTTAKGSCVAAVNEVDAHADTAQGDADAAQADADTALAGIGTLANLTTAEKGSAVGAISEVDGHADAAQADADTAQAAADAAQADADTALASIGILANLTTTVKTDLVVAVNEVDANADAAQADADTALARVAVHQADSAAVDVAGIVADFNDLLAALETAGLIATQ